MGHPPLNYWKADNSRLELPLLLWGRGGDLIRITWGDNFPKPVHKLCLPLPTKSESKMEEGIVVSLGVCKYFGCAPPILRPVAVLPGNGKLLEGGSRLKCPQHQMEGPIH